MGDPEIPGSAIPPGPIAYHQHYLCLELLVLHGDVENVNRQLASHVRTLSQHRRDASIVGADPPSDASARDD